MNIIQEIREKLRLTFGSQHTDDFQQGRISLANEIADMFDRADAEDKPIPADDRFPDRPAHPDFARMSAAAIEMDHRSDESDDSVLPPEMIGIDGDTLAYMAGQRIGRACEHPLVQLMPRTIQLQGAWCDGFAVGVEYQKRGGSRPTETGTTGEKEGSL